MTTELARYQALDMDHRWEYARRIAAAGLLLPSALRKGPEGQAGAVYLIHETGAMLGIHPIAAINGVHVIEGKPTLSPSLMSALLRQAGHTVRITESGSVEGGDYQAVATLIRHDDPEHPFTSTWTPHRAARAGLATYARDADGVWRVTARGSQGGTKPWEAYTESMCKARALSEVARDGGTDVFVGAAYTPEEVGAVVNDLGDLVAEPIRDESPAEDAPAKPNRKRATTGRQGTRKAEATPEAADAAPTAEPVAEAPAEVVPEATPEPVEDGPRSSGYGDADPDELARQAREHIAQDRADRQRYADEKREAAYTPTPVEPDPADEVVDAEVVEDEPPADEGPAAVLADEPDPAAPSAYELATEAGPTNWEARAAAVSTVEQVRQVWDDATSIGQRTPEVAAMIQRHKARVLGEAGA